MIQILWTCDRCRATYVTPYRFVPAGWLMSYAIGVDACADCLTTDDHAAVLRAALDSFDASEPT